MLFRSWTGPKKNRQPHLIHLLDGRPFALAGLWNDWADPAGGEVLATGTIITCAVNEFMRPYHDRMPVVVDAAAVERWLDPSVPAQELVPLLAPYPSEQMAAYPTVKQANDYDGPALLERAPGLAPPSDGGAGATLWAE